MKIKKKTFKSFKDKYKHYINSIKMNIEITQKKIYIEICLDLLMNLIYY